MITVKVQEPEIKAFDPFTLILTVNNEADWRALYAIVNATFSKGDFIQDAYETSRRIKEVLEAYQPKKIGIQQHHPYPNNQQVQNTFRGQVDGTIARKTSR